MPSRGVMTAPFCCSTHGSGPKTARSPVSISRCARRGSGRTFSGICSRVRRRPPARRSNSSDPRDGPDSPDNDARRHDPMPDVVFEGIRDRLSLLPIGLDVTQAVISPDGKTACVVACRPASRISTRTRSTTFDRSARGAAVDDDDGAEGRPAVHCRQQGGLLPRRRPHQHRDGRPARGPAAGVTAEMTVDFSAERSAIFTQAWTLMRDNFYDAAIHGVDWERRASVRRACGGASKPGRDAPAAAVDGRRPEFVPPRRQRASSAGDRRPAGRALRPRRRMKRRAACRDPEIMPLGPVALAAGLATGDVIGTVDGRPTAGANLD